ncbi:MAG: OsmC family protein [Rectinemataceae bacterium]
MVHGKTHAYAIRLRWEGNLGRGTKDYTGYGRGFRVSVAGKPDMVGSADPAFRGDADRHNPEELLVIALSSCHMLSYLALCAHAGISVVEYGDEAGGVMRTTPEGGGSFESVTLRPRVTIVDTAREAEAMALHERAHALCYIASSCNFPVLHRAEVICV